MKIFMRFNEIEYRKSFKIAHIKHTCPKRLKIQIISKEAGRLLYLCNAVYFLIRTTNILIGQIHSFFQYDDYSNSKEFENKIDAHDNKKKFVENIVGFVKACLISNLN